MKENKQRPNSVAHDSATKADSWNSKFQVLADSLQNHIREEEHEKPGSKGVYIDFKQLE